MKRLKQIPAPGTYVLSSRGDVFELTLTLPCLRSGDAWLRTNIGNGHMRTKEIIQHVEENQSILAYDWHDIPMRQIDGTHYSIKLPLVEVGRFEAKSFFLSDESSEPIWPEGENIVIKVEPAEYCCANTVYTAFVRQFGPNQYCRSVRQEEECAVRELETSGYTVIPRSGTFRDLIRELDFIIGKLRCRIIHLLPVHPVPTTYARMGKFGSPFAALDFENVDPALAEFDRETTPLDQFRELADAIHERCAKLFIDIPVNHTGWASRLQIEHPEWFVRSRDRKFQSPGAWGVTWEDLSKLDYRQCKLWRYMAHVFLFWCRHGVDGFRCDAGYMVPCSTWEYLVAKVRREYPDTIFLLEGLGGKPETVEALLADANMNWAYSELFQNYDQSQIESYLPRSIQMSLAKGILIHFAETHDNERLAARSSQYARLRTALAAFCSHSGAFGITNGVEWFADEKIDVHGAPSLNWGSEENQVDLLARLSVILESHPAFHAGGKLRMVQRGHHNSIALVRETVTRKESPLLVLVNLNENQPEIVRWKQDDYVIGNDSVHDLITGKQIKVKEDGEMAACALNPGEVLCLTPDPSDLQEVETVLNRSVSLPERIKEQCLRAKTLEIYQFLHGTADISAVDIDRQAHELSRDPREYCSACSTDYESQVKACPSVVTWEWARDVRRVVMVPPGHFLYIKSACHFVAELRDNEKTIRREISLLKDDGSYFAVMLPLDEPAMLRTYTLMLAVYERDKCRRAQASVIYLPRWQNALVLTSFGSQEVQKLEPYALCTNGRGAMVQVHGAWGKIRSQYDALLAGNLDPNYPVDRHVMLTRCRTWLVYRGYSQEINDDYLESFSVDRNGSVTWCFAVSAGQGKLVLLDIRLVMHKDSNAITMNFCRRRLKSGDAYLSDAIPIKIIVRPDIEDRVCHEKTKAYTGPETSWPRAVVHDKDGFSFAPSGDRRLHVLMTRGAFTWEPEWIYMVLHPFDGDRGFDDRSDLFSPGYFTLNLQAGQHGAIVAGILAGKQKEEFKSSRALSSKQIHKSPLRIDKAMRLAMRHFIVKRDDSKTVIAGYPWFLDWGRDTLICLRGMIAAGMLDEAREILKQFARLESQGTLPNMIRGNNDSNRDTSDAPLWFFVACNDLMQVDGNEGLLDVDCGGRTIHEVLKSIVTWYINGTRNGIRMDPRSGLIFSPSHFTWMDTNYPVGSPREGYPVEIQALWHAALTLLAKLEPERQWKELACQVCRSIRTFFTRNSCKFLSDCLHARTGELAEDAVADDALRPNQLLAITLSAIEDADLCSAILSACEELLVPGAIRSLADSPVDYDLPIRHHGKLLNDPSRPYWGHYSGDEDTRRKPAYHNGTAWTWLFPSYSEALFMTYGEQSRDTALAILSSSVEIINQGCVGQVPEITDGDAPHTLRGCGAQAWGVTELYRVFAILTKR